MHAVDKCLKKQVKDAIDDSFLSAATFGTLGFGNRTTLDILHILFRSFGRVSAIKKDANNNKMKKPYNVNNPIEHLFKQI